MPVKSVAVGSPSTGADHKESKNENQTCTDLHLVVNNSYLHGIYTGLGRISHLERLKVYERVGIGYMQMLRHFI